MLVWHFVYRAHAAALETRWFAWLAWSGSIAFGVWATFFLLSLPFNIVAALAEWLAGAQAHATPAERLGLLAVAMLVSTLGVYRALAGPVVRTVTIPVDNLAAGLEGLTIAQISDLHVGPTIRRHYVERVVRATMALGADLIAVTGDLADGHAERLAADIEPLRRLSAPLGIFYVTGNHEYYWNAAAWLAAAENLGFRTLVNEHRRLVKGGASLLVAGVADSAAAHFIPGHRGDPQAARDGADRADFSLLLAHRPDVCKAAAAAGYDLQLSGHTHGGQFFPFNLVVRLAHRFHRGLSRHGRMWLYVSPGTGYWGPPHRFSIPAEITLIRLCRAGNG